MQEEKIIITQNIVVENKTITSAYLKREVKIDAYLPVNITQPEEMELLLINDGQDLPEMPFDKILNYLVTVGAIEPLVCIGIHCGIQRMEEYGTAKQLDYQGRGTKAKRYNKFVFKELLPFIHNTYALKSFKRKSFAGFSMGALSALDIVWNNPTEFSKAGIFSGSLWWRSKSYKDGYNENTDRIMHRQIREGKYYPGLKFFIECGAMDESKDRNNNGIIDSIDDARDLVKELKLKGYTDDAIKYLELPDGKHDVSSWAKAFPAFLKWGWGR